MRRAETSRFFAQLLRRNDHNIGVLEAVVVVTSVAAFADKLACADVVCFVDNQGVLGSMIASQSRSPEVNTLAGWSWLKAARMNTYL